MERDSSLFPISSLQGIIWHHENEMKTMNVVLTTIGAVLQGTITLFQESNANANVLLNTGDAFPRVVIPSWCHNVPKWPHVFNVFSHK